MGVIGIRSAFRRSFDDVCLQRWLVFSNGMIDDSADGRGKGMDGR